MKKEKIKSNDILIALGFILLIIAVYLFIAGSLFWFRFIMQILLLLAFITLFVDVVRLKKEVKHLKDELKNKS